jgi:anti-anti-sigma factor
MGTTDAIARTTVADFADGAGVIVRFKDAFLNYATSESLAAEVRALCSDRASAGARWVVVDVSAVVVMDSCGLSLLVSMKRAAEAGGARLRLFGLSPMIRRLFTVAKVERAFEIFDDERAALEPPARAG